MILKTEEEMIDFGFKLGREISAPCVIELVGDVGAGKTTIVKGIAKGLGVTEAVTSPSFTLSKRYNFKDGVLAHYDFYRLSDPGIMSEDLIESIDDEKSVVVVEWADSVAELLPENRRKFSIILLDDGSREVREEK